jgi:hypothetical protein
MAKGRNPEIHFAGLASPYSAFPDGAMEDSATAKLSVRVWQSHWRAIPRANLSAPIVDNAVSAPLRMDAASVSPAASRRFSSARTPIMSAMMHLTSVPYSSGVRSSPSRNACNCSKSVSIISISCKSLQAESPMSGGRGFNFGDGALSHNRATP